MTPFRTLALTITITMAFACAVPAPRRVANLAEEQSLRLVASSQRADSTLMWLAYVWSGSEGPARCGRTPPPNEVMWFPGGRYCELLSDDRGQIGLRIDERGLIRVLTWDRQTASRGHARSLTDSLDVVLRRRALTPRLCRPDSGYRADLPGMIWENEGLLVHLSWITRGDNRPKLLAIAVNDPGEYPHFLCKPFDQARTSFRCYFALSISLKAFPMCRNIKTLANFAPPATDDEIRASALQFVRKLSGTNKPSRANEAAFNQAVEEVTAAAHRLIHSLHTSAPPRDRDEEMRKARERSRQRFGQTSSPMAAETPA